MPPAKIDPERRRIFQDRLATVFKARRADLGLSQAQVSIAAELNPLSYTAIELGRALPSLPVFADICRVLHLDPSWVLGSRPCDHCQGTPPAGYRCLACGAATSATRREAATP